MIHNHPSNNPNPSRQDVEITKRIVENGEMMGIQVMDHIIITSTQYFSFRENGYIKVINNVF